MSQWPSTKRVTSTSVSRVAAARRCDFLSRRDFLKLCAAGAALAVPAAATGYSLGSNDTEPTPLSKLEDEVDELVDYFHRRRAAVTAAVSAGSTALQVFSFLSLYPASIQRGLNLPTAEHVVTSGKDWRPVAKIEPPHIPHLMEAMAAKDAQPIRQALAALSRRLNRIPMGADCVDAITLRHWHTGWSVRVARVVSRRFTTPVAHLTPLWLADSMLAALVTIWHEWIMMVAGSRTSQITVLPEARRAEELQVHVQITNLKVNLPHSADSYSLVVWNEGGGYIGLPEWQPAAPPPVFQPSEEQLVDA